MDTEKLDFSKRYAVQSYPGIAFRIQRYLEEPHFDEFLVCDDEDCWHEFETCYVVDSYTDINYGMVVAIMVGDDREHIIDVDELTPIEDDDYCGGCGQIGCGW